MMSYPALIMKTLAKVEFQESEIVKIHMEIRRLQKGQLQEIDSEDLQKVMQENVKLKHRLSILNAVCTPQCQHFDNACQLSYYL